MDDGYDSRKTTNVSDPSECIIDLREYDVPYHVRVAIDKGAGSSVNRGGIISVLILMYFRHKSWKVVHCRSQTWSHHHRLHHRSSPTSRPRSPRFRYRNYKAPLEISRFPHRPNHDDIIYDRWPRFPPYQS